jgi:hypothetical protein
MISILLLSTKLYASPTMSKESDSIFSLLLALRYSDIQFAAGPKSGIFRGDTHFGRGGINTVHAHGILSQDAIPQTAVTGLNLDTGQILKKKNLETNTLNLHDPGYINAVKDPNAPGLSATAMGLTQSGNLAMGKPPEPGSFAPQSPMARDPSSSSGAPPGMSLTPENTSLPRRMMVSTARSPPRAIMENTAVG